jgi:hypothetical protein
MARVVVTEAALGDEAAILADLGVKGGYRVAEKYKALLDRLYGLFGGSSGYRPAPLISRAARANLDRHAVHRDL